MAILEGVVVRWNETGGFGFIEQRDNEKDIFVHRTALQNADRLHLGDRVTYEATFDAFKDKFMALDVCVVECVQDSSSSDSGSSGGAGLLATPKMVPKILLKVPASQCSTAASTPTSCRVSIAPSVASSDRSSIAPCVPEEHVDKSSLLTPKLLPDPLLLVQDPLFFAMPSPASSLASFRSAASRDFLSSPLMPTPYLAVDPVMSLAFALAPGTLPKLPKIQKTPAFRFPPGLDIPKHLL